MAKVCKFCNLENEDTEEFCTRCSAKLPTYCQYEAGLMDEINTKKNRFKLNFAKLFNFLLIAVLIIAVVCIFVPINNEDETLPPIAKNRSALKALNVYFDSLPNNISVYGTSINTNSNALSLYLSSLINPAAADPQKNAPDLMPRIILKAPSNEPNSISLVKHSKFMFLPLRLELSFRKTNKVWKLESWKFCRLPAMKICKDKISNYAIKEFKAAPKFKPIFEQAFTFDRTKLYIFIDVKSRSAENGKISQINSVKARLLKPFQGISDKLHKAVRQ